MGLTTAYKAVCGTPQRNFARPSNHSFHPKEMTVVKTHVLVTVAAFLLATVALAGEYQNLDAIRLAAGKGQRTKCDIKEQIKGKTYCFGDESTRAQTRPIGILAI
jgi:hypothetical protein